MNVQEATQLISSRLGNRPNMMPLVTLELNAAIRELEKGKELPRFLLTETAHIDCTPDDERLPLPTNFLREYTHGALWWYDPEAVANNNLKKLRKGFYEDIIREEYDVAEIPQRYALVGKYFRLRPIPSTVHRFKMFYFGSDVPLVAEAASTNKWLTEAADLVVAAAGVTIASFLQNQTALTLFTAMHEKQYQNFLVNITEDEEVNSERNAGDD